MRGAGRTRVGERLGGAVWLCVLALAACHAPFGGGNVLSPRGKKDEPVRAFTHKSHEATLDPLGYACEQCHVSVAGDLTEEVSPEGKASCHACHKEGAAGGAKASSRCGACHADLRSVLPSSHAAGWVNTHGPRVNATRQECSHCHSNRFCVSCHSRRDQAERTFHRGNILMTHPIEARTDPAQCQRCHRADACVRCHSLRPF